jgi:2-polyprenyl-3-methyl-5-hydroxy-6-metoxy-1,4-benzoquinol methylase
MRRASRAVAHFQRLYDASPDPWGFASNPYEQAKYRETLLALGDRRFASGLEIGCSIGVLTRMLAPHCDALLGVDLVEQPLQAARTRCADQPRVRFQRMQVPAAWPAGQF